MRRYGSYDPNLIEKAREGSILAKVFTKQDHDCFLGKQQ
jgi:hypothetical protein